MPTLDTSDDVIAIKLQEDVIQTLNGKSFKHFAGDALVLPQGTVNLELSTTTPVGIMFDPRLAHGQWMLPGFSLDDIRDPS